MSATTPSNRPAPAGVPADRRPLLLHGCARTPEGGANLAGLETFYHGVVVTAGSLDEIALPGIAVERYDNPDNFRVPPVVELAHRLISRHGMPAAAVGHLVAGSALLLPVLRLLDIPLVTLFGDADLAAEPGDRAALDAIIGRSTLFLCGTESARQSAIALGCPAGRTFVWRPADPVERQIPERDPETRRRCRRLAAHVEHAMELHAQRDEPLTFFIPTDDGRSESDAWKTRPWRGGLKALRRVPASPDKLWEPYAGSHRKGVGRLVRLWKRFTYSAILRPVLTLVADLLRKLHEEADHEDLWFAEDVLRHNIQLARELAQRRTRRPGRSAARGPTMDCVACGDCPHCIADLPWPQKECPMDLRCLETLTQEFADTACGSHAAPAPDNIRERLQFWLQNAGASVAAVSDADGTMFEGQPKTLLFESDRLDAEDESLDAVPASLSAETTSTFRRRLSEAGRILRPGGRLVLWAGPLGKNAWGKPTEETAVPFQPLLFRPDVLAEAGAAHPCAEDLAGPGDIRSALVEAGLRIVCFQPDYDSAFPVTMAARMRSALAPWNPQDLMTTGIFCVCDKSA